jgi:hypothetical protein
VVTWIRARFARNSLVGARERTSWSSLRKTLPEIGSDPDQRVKKMTAETEALKGEIIYTL